MNYYSNDPEYQCLTIGGNGVTRRIDRDYHVSDKYKNQVSNYLITNRLKDRLNEIDIDLQYELHLHYRNAISKKRLRDDDYTDADGRHFGELLTSELEIVLEKLTRKELLRCRRKFNEGGLKAMCFYLLNNIIENETKIF